MTDLPRVASRRPRSSEAALGRLRGGKSRVTFDARTRPMDFRILGPLEVFDCDRRLALGGTKQRALLGLLLLHANEVVSSDRLVDELWDEAGLAEGSKALHVAVSRLRRALEPEPASGGERQVLVTSPP